MTIDKPGIYTARYQSGSWLGYNPAYVSATATARWHPLGTIDGWFAFIFEVGCVLVKCKGGEDLFSRRGGLEYGRIEARLRYESLQIGVISIPVFLLNIRARIPLQLAPNRIRGLVYRTLTGLVDDSAYVEYV